MPELPEVETTINGLKQLLDRKIEEVWCDNKKMVRKAVFSDFKQKIIGTKIKDLRRRGKLILIDLSQEQTLLIHQKLTGHLLIGTWTKQDNRWNPKTLGPLQDKANRYIHLVLTLDNGQMLALSDLRKFAKVELWDSQELKNSKQINKLGPEPLAKDFSFEDFKTYFKGRTAAIKTTLMNQEVIAGIGNIYSDEILWRAKIDPFKSTNKLSREEFNQIFKAMKKVLNKAIKLKGESISDYRRPSGAKGNFDQERKVYRREGESCPRCGTTIKRKKISGRSAHYCPQCQK